MYKRQGHDHVNGNLNLHEGYQLEQIVPSFLDFLRTSIKSVNEENNEPIIIMINISKIKIAPLLPMTEKKLEKWLENRWGKKDKLINKFETNIKMK